MRRIRITATPTGRICLALFRWDRDDPSDFRQTTTLWNCADGPNEWYDGRNGRGGSPWQVSGHWPYMLVFADGQIGMARDHDIDAALASVGLRLVAT